MISIIFNKGKGTMTMANGNIGFGYIIEVLAGYAVFQFCLFLCNRLLLLVLSLRSHMGMPGQVVFPKGRDCRCCWRCRGYHCWCCTVFPLRGCSRKKKARVVQRDREPFLPSSPNLFYLIRSQCGTTFSLIETFSSSNTLTYIVVIF